MTAGKRGSTHWVSPSEITPPPPVAIPRLARPAGARLDPFTHDDVHATVSPGGRLVLPWPEAYNALA